MNSAPLKDGVLQALEAGCLRVRTMPGGWLLTLLEAPPLEVSARVHGDWFLLEAPVPSSLNGALPGEARPDSFWEALRRNRDLPGGWKFAWATGRRGFYLSAAVSRIEGIDVSRRLREAAGSFAAAMGRRFEPERTGRGEGRGGLRAGSAPLPRPPLDLPRLCREAGWPCVEKADGPVLLELEIDDATPFQQAAIESTKEGGLAIRVETASFGELRPACGEALGLFFLTTCGAIPLLRPVAGRREEREVVDLQVLLPSGTTPAELALALEACSLGYQLSSLEARALEDESLAREYLAQRGAAGPLSSARTSQPSILKE
jgi:hypothetical protein